MQAILVESICDVKPLILRKWMWINSLGRCDAVFPLFLHLSMHDQERVVWEVNANLTLCVCKRAVCFLMLVVLRNNLAHAELPGYSETQAADYCAGAEISELVGMVSDTLLGAIVAVDESGVGLPWARRLVLELFTIGVVVAYSTLDFAVDSFFDLWTCRQHLREALSHILNTISE